jgi:hypothetical protein
MTILRQLLIATLFVVGFNVWPAGTPGLNAQLGGPQSVMTCSSEGGRRQYCPADTRGGVLLVRKISDSDCVFEESWGFDRGGVWVDRGCRAEFGVGSQSFPGFGESYTIYCASDNGRRERCDTDTRGGVSLVRQRSDSACVFGSTWGLTRRGIWVDRGCRADFRLGGMTRSPDSSARIIYCASESDQRNFCQADTRGGVRMVRQRSDADCRLGRTWGYDRNGIWVDRGCRADFELLGR